MKKKRERISSYFHPRSQKLQQTTVLASANVQTTVQDPHAPSHTLRMLPVSILATTLFASKAKLRCSFFMQLLLAESVATPRIVIVITYQFSESAAKTHRQCDYHIQTKTIDIELARSSHASQYLRVPQTCQCNLDVCKSPATPGVPMVFTTLCIPCIERQINFRSYEHAQWVHSSPWLNSQRFTKQTNPYTTERVRGKIEASLLVNKEEERERTSS